MSLPYYKRFPRDYLDACVGMTFELRAGYGMILDLIYLKDGRLPLDKPWIAGHLGCSVRMFTSILDGLVRAGKLTVSDGFITNKRADKLVEETRKYRDNQSEIAAKPRKNKDVQQPKPSQSDTDTEDKKESPLSPKGEKKKSPRRALSTIPEGFPDLEALKVARDMVAEAGVAVRVRDEAEKMRDWAISKGERKADWMATWRNWIRTACERKPALGLVQREVQTEHDPWPMRVRAWVNDTGWNHVDWGPEPFERGCKVPAHHLPPRAAE